MGHPQVIMVVQYEVVVIHDLDDFGYPKFEETSNWICKPIGLCQLEIRYVKPAANPSYGSYKL